VVLDHPHVALKKTMEEDKDIEFSAILDQAGKQSAPQESSPTGSILTNKVFEKEKLDWRIKLTLGLVIILLILGIGFSAYLLNPTFK
jgi:hypothetical protein